MEYSIPSPIETPKAISQFLELMTTAGERFSPAVDAPETESGDWFFDFSSADESLTVEWCEGFGFGLHSSETTFGEQPQEVYRTADLAARRVKQWAEQIETGVSGSIWLRELRQLHGISQEALADSLSVKQGAISKLENRSEIKLGSLKNYVEAMGGQLDIQIHFPDCQVPIEMEPQATEVSH